MGLGEEVVYEDQGKDVKGEVDCELGKKGTWEPEGQNNLAHKGYFGLNDVAAGFKARWPMLDDCHDL